MNMTPITLQRALRVFCGTLVPLVWALVPTPTYAQMKVGQNPGTRAADVLLQIEATDGSQVVVRQSTAQVGINTPSPGNRLEVNAGSGNVNTSGVRLTQVKNAVLLGTDANGDVVKTSSCTCGDVKASLRTDEHDGWVLMNGNRTGTCGSYNVNATNKLMTMQGSPGTSRAATGLVRSQLPNVTLSGNITNWYVPYSNGSTSTLWLSSQANGSYFARTQPFPIDFDLNGGVTQTMLTVDNLPWLNVNYFVCVK